MKKCLVGVISWCDSNRFPQRFTVFKKTVNSIQRYLDRSDVITAIVDNASTQDVQDFIESSPIFDIKVLLNENTQDVGAYGILAQIAKDQNCQYVWFLENDYVLFRKPDILEAITFLEEHPECGYLRLQKFEYTNQEKYEKGSKNKIIDSENSVWLKNLITGKPLEWSEPVRMGSANTYHINNWHFGLHGGLISLENWHKLYPKLISQTPYYYKFETYMRDKYHQKGFKTAMLDKGVFSMEAPSVYQPKASVLKNVTSFFGGEKGGYIGGSIISYYQKNYHDFGPVQIQLFSNSLGDDELKILKQVFDSRWLGYGARSKQFETEFAQMLGCKYALGIASCTAGLFMSMEMLGIKKGDEVILPSVSFIGAANAVLKAGAKPVFVDVDKKYFNILPSELEKAITKKTRAVLLLHYGGIPSDMNAIKKILQKQKQKIYIIEDSANSIKSLYKGTYCGNIGDIGLFSLDANKVITTGTGGVMTLNDEYLYYKAQVMRFYGLKPTLSSGYDAMRARREKWWEIELEHPGNRYLINDITSAIALGQMKKLDQFIKKRKQIWQFYNRRLETIKNIKLPYDPPKGTTSSYYFYWLQVHNEAEQVSLAKYLVKNGIYTTFRYYPLHMVDFYKSKASLPNSEQIAHTTLNLPLHHNLSHKDLDRIINTIKDWSQRKR
ncbi:hypothetical protein C4564_00615 [Candidatus Microgenomates bacterium]|nr:MAG: hypothetical protein C4564_00615 [Candidatus Microgenomates bacterium]